MLKNLYATRLCGLFHKPKILNLKDLYSAPAPLDTGGLSVKMEVCSSHCSQ
jgi:hypothetical protein